MSKLKENAQTVVIRNLMYEFLFEVSETSDANGRIKAVNNFSNRILDAINVIDTDFKAERKKDN